jgi:hypothetical protein
MRALRRVGHPRDVPDVVGRLDTLEDILRWSLAQPPWELAQVIAQDEYCQDVIVRGPGPVFLAFDTT